LGRSDDKNAIRAALGTPTPNRILQVAQAMRLGWSNEEIFTSCKIDPWFLGEMRGIVEMESKIRAHGLPHNALDFVFHGGSGSSAAEIEESISYGVIKMNIDTDTQWATWDGILQYYKKNEGYLQSQLGNPEGADKPNKKYYDPRVWLRSAQASMVVRLEQAFKELNAVDVL